MIPDRIKNNEIAYRKQTEEEVKQETILTLKQNLSKTDYMCLKYAEGELTEEEYAPIKAQRKEWRTEINRLEGELNNGK